MEQLTTILVATLANSDVERCLSDKIIRAYSYLQVLRSCYPELLSPLELEVLAYWQHIECDESELFQQYQRQFLAWMDEGNYVGPQNPLQG